MDRDTLQDDLDLILERTRDDELPGEWDWEPPLGTGAPAAGSAAEPKVTQEAGIEASSEEASDPVDGPEDGPEGGPEDEAEDDAEDEEEEDD
jgi:hypothetical protein